MPDSPALQTGPPPDPGLRHNLTIAALGVGYGDIGTSALYAIKQCSRDVAVVTEPWRRQR